MLLRLRFGFMPEEVTALLDFLAAEGEPVLAEALGLELSDPGDVPFLEVAITGKAEALVTGNLRHFEEAAASRDIRLQMPAEFVARWK